MLKKLFLIDYDNKIILDMIKSNRLGIVATNLIGPIITVSVLYTFIPNIYLFIWFSLHIILAASRIYVGKQLSAIIERDSDKYSYYNLYIMIISFNAILYSTIAWMAVLSNVPDINIFIIGIIIMAITAGSIATVGMVFLVFLTFIFFSIIPFIFALIFHGGMVFYLFAFILAFYASIHTLSGYRLFSSNIKTISLEKKFKTLFDKSSDGIAIIKNNQIVECNAALPNMFAYELNDFFNIKLFNLTPKTQPDGRSSTKQMLLKLRKAKKDRITFEWLHMKKNGDNFWVEITLSMIELNQEKVIHGIWRDISNRKKAEFEIKNLNSTLESKIKVEVEKNREKDKHMLQQSRLIQMGEMISMIAHQWRQPLNAISATSAGLEVKTFLDKADKETIIKSTQDISKYSQHLSSTIEDFRNFFKADKEEKSVSFDEIINSVIGIAKVSIQDKNIKLIKELNSKDKFKTHPNELKQVILNLIKNAEDVVLEKNIANAYIKISSYTLDNSNILEISDNGGGVPEDIIDKIFDPYFSTKKEKNGTGLGLYMSRTIIEEHCHGKLNILNDENGAVFKITLKSIE